jgi:hypothetical protein
MTNRAAKAAAKNPGPGPSEPRYELVFERRFLTRVVAELKSLADRGGSALGDVYALAATSFLNRSERLEDLNAERKYRQRSSSNARASVRAPAPRSASQPQTSSLTK